MLILDVELPEPLDVELPPTSHATLRETQGFEINLCPTSTQKTRDAVSKQWTPCPSDYRVIRHCHVFSSDVGWWPWDNRREKASCRSAKFLSDRCWAVATAVKDSTGSMHNCVAASVSCKLGRVCSTLFLPWRSTSWKEAFLSYFSLVLLPRSWLAANPCGQQRDKACHSVLLSLGCCCVPSGISSRL